MSKTLDNVLRFGKKVIKPLVKPMLLSGALLIGGNAYSQQYQAKNTDKINVFVQPNDSTLAYYGSLDVYQDNILNWDDYNKMVAEAPQIDEADLNGNGIPSDPQDIQIAADYLNGNIEYLPAQWNKLPTREERIDWLDKMLAIDQTDTITYNDPYWISRDYAQQTYINFQGYDEEAEEHNQIPNKYTKEDNGRFNIPVFYSGYSFPGGAHGKNGVNVEENAKNPFHWVYPDQTKQDQYNDLYILGENWNPPAGSTINTTKINWFKEGGLFDATPLVQFKSDDAGTIILDSYNPNLIETREQAMDETYPYLTLTAPENNSIQNSKQTQISISGTDSYFDRIGYSLNNADITWFSTPDTSFYINSQEGENEFLAIAEDKAGNQTLEKRVYTVDSTFVGVEDEQNIPKGYSLEQNYPNPFNPSTTIQFDIPSAVIASPIHREKQSQTKEITSSYQNIGTSRNDNVTLIIYDITGNEVAILVNEPQPPGEYSVKFNANVGTVATCPYKAEFISTNYRLVIYH